MAARNLNTMFPGHFATAVTTKRIHAQEYGWPDRLNFADLLFFYYRNGLANAAVKKTKAKTWQTVPIIRVGEEGSELSEIEEAIKNHLARIRFWQQFAEADARSMVGDYAGLILQIGDGQPANEPLSNAAGILQIKRVRPCWQHQLRPVEYNTDTESDEYGDVTMWEYQEAALDSGQMQQGPRRRFKLPPDRVLIFSRDGTIHDRSQLEAGFNALFDAEKIMGAGAEGFFKTAKNAPVLSMEDDSGFTQLAKAMGVDEEEVSDKLSDIVKDWAAGFDASLLLSKMNTEFPNITLPQPEQFWRIAAQTFAATFEIPLRILIGSETGERASTEDAKEWSKTNEARRTNEVVPIIMTFIERMQAIGVLPKGVWTPEWESLLDDGPDAKLGRGKTMSQINKDEGDAVFTVEEIRVAAGHSAEPESDGDETDEEPPDDEE